MNYLHLIYFYRDDDILYVSSGEDFIYKNKVANDDQINENSEWITLNVGGKYFTTTRSTLTKNEPMSMLARFEYLIFFNYMIILELCNAKTVK